MKEETIAVILVCVAMSGLFAVGFMLGSTFGTWQSDRELIKRGLKQYNTTTGVIEWVEKE